MLSADLSLRALLTSDLLTRDQLERHFRSESQVAYLGEHRAICRVLGKFLMQVPTYDLSIAPHLLLDGCWEMWQTLAVARYLQPGMTSIDVGANFGYYTLLCEYLSEGGHTVAVEPVDATVSHLKDTIRINGSSALVAQVAAADDALGANFISTSTDLGGAKVVHGSMVECRKPTVRLDALVQRAHFVKVDAEGSELRIWIGMEGLIERARADGQGMAVMLEFQPHTLEALDGTAAPTRLLELIEQAGFPLRSVTETGRLSPVLTKEQALQPDTGTYRTLWLQI